ncbi:anthrone oxygenase family protein [Streptomyces sp. NPDC004051]
MIEGPSSMPTALTVLAVSGALGTGLVAGVFCAFSTFVMRGLAALPPARGVAAMQSVNVAAVRAPFMLVFLGSALLCAAVAVVTAVSRPDEGAVGLLVGSALYLFGGFGVTAAANVPRNDVLAGLAPDTAEACAYWTAYVRGWMLWNHVRTVASAGAALSYVLVLA